MALTQFPQPPGVFKDDTPLKREGYVIDAQWMRWDLDGWETIGGYERATSQSFDGIARGAHAWADISGTRALAFGTAAKLYAFYGGQVLDITPFKARETLTNAFSTQAGSPIVVVAAPAHGLKSGDVATFQAADPVGGITVSGPYTVDVLTPGIFRITTTTNATSTATGGGSVDYSVPLDVGLVDGIGGLGYGSGTYGGGFYGVTLSGDIHARVWSLDNFGQNLLGLWTNGALVEYQPLPVYPELIRNTAATDWTLGTGWAWSAGILSKTAGTASDATENLVGQLSGGVTYDLTFEVTDRTAGGFQFRVTNASSPTAPFDVALGATVAKNGVYSRRFQAPANPTFIKFAADANFNGKIKNISIKPSAQAYRIYDAPQYSRDMFVDPGGFVILLGTVMLDGSFNAMGVRWSDQRNNRTWAPNTNVKAGFTVLSVGSEIRGGLATRSQNLIWTDSALYSLRQVGGTDTFRSDLVGSNAGLIHKNAMVEHLGRAFWWGTDRNFHIFEGGAPQILECTLRDDVMTNLARGQESKITCGVNSAFNEVWWIYPDQRDGPGGIGGTECSRYVIYKWSNGTWYSGKLARSQWVGDGVFQNPIALSPDGAIYFHEIGGTANGNELTASLGPAEVDLGEGDQLMRMMRFVGDFRVSSGNVRMIPGFRMWPQGPERLYGPYDNLAGRVKVDMRHTGRVMTTRYEMSGNPLSVRFGRIEIDVDATGSNR